MFDVECSMFVFNSKFRTSNVQRSTFNEDRHFPSAFVFDSIQMRTSNIQH